MNRTKIDYVTHTWNPITGCLHGCPYCYARRQAERGLGAYGRLPKGERFKPRFWPGRLAEPLNAVKPRRVLVCSMGDLFGLGVSDNWRDEVLGVMGACAGRGFGHTFLVLTKRPEEARRYMTQDDTGSNVRVKMQENGWESREDLLNIAPPGSVLPDDPVWPLPNVWLGTSCEDQAAAGERIPLLLETPAAIRWVSLEPLLGPVDLGEWLYPWHTESAHAEDCDGTCRNCPVPVQVQDDLMLNWVVVGAQTGPGAVTPEEVWVRDIIRQCREAGVPVFCKANLGFPDLPRQYPQGVELQTDLNPYEGHAREG
ncbi:MAG: DUF5131 family protein [bacterium]|nr:DUF5131 family protein [bacterium]